MKIQRSRAFFTGVLVLSCGLIVVFFQNCGDVSLSDRMEPQALFCSDLAASRPEAIYADASTDPNKIIFRLHERDNSNNSLSVSQRRFTWSVDQVVRMGGELASELEINTSSLLPCDLFQVTATLEACGNSIEWRLNYQLQNPTRSCPPPPTTTQATTTTLITTTTQNTVPPQEQVYSGPSPASCQTGSSGVCITPTDGPNGTTVMSGMNLGLIVTMPGQSGLYGYTFIAAEQTFVIPYRTRSTDHGTNLSSAVRSLKIYNPGIYQSCFCKFSISKTPGDFRPLLAGPNYPGGGSHRCMGFTGTDAGVGHSIAIFPTSATNIQSGNFCPLKPNSDYYLNVYCGGPHNGPAPLTQALESYPWQAHFGCDSTDPLYTSSMEYYFGCQRCAISSAEQ